MTASPLTEIQTVPMRLTVPVVLGATVLLATAVHAVLAAGSPSPWIVPDELIYSELAKSMAAGGLPAIRDEVSFAYGIGYPALLAPVWAVFNDVTTAYAVAKALNALILSLTAVPAYFLARRFVAEAPALVVAALSVAVPSMLYAGTLMTEIALYPAFVLALLGMTVALERPTLATQAGALGAIALASAIKMLAAILVLAYVAAILLYHWLDARENPRSRGQLRAYAPTWIALAGALTAAVAIAVAFGRSPADAFGAYAVVLGNIDVRAVPWWALLHFAELDLYVAVIPFAATLTLIWRGVRQGADHRERLFAALSIPSCVGLITVVALFASTPFPGGADYPENAARLHERSTFVVAPLFLIGLVLAARGSRVPGIVLVPTAVLAAGLPAVIPIDRVAENAASQAPALFPWVASQDAAVWPLGCMILTSALAALYVAQARVALTIGPIAMVFLITTSVSHGAMESASHWTKDRSWGTSPSWIDHEVGNATVSVLWAESRTDGRFVEQEQRHFVLWLGELFNRSVGDVYELGTPMPYGLPSTRVRLEDGRVALVDGRPASLGELVLAPCHVRVVGVPIARDPSTGAVVVRVRGPVRARVLEPGSCPGGSRS